VSDRSLAVTAATAALSFAAIPVDDLTRKFLSRDATVTPCLDQTECAQAVLSACRAVERPLGVIPTAGGKFLIAGMPTHHCCRERGECVLTLVPTRELVPQNLTALRSVSPDINVAAACAGYAEPDMSGATVIGTFQTVVRRIDQDPSFDLIIIDEAHQSLRCLAEATP
jgi:superfamily II DNA or RNA helicase